MTDFSFGFTEGSFPEGYFPNKEVGGGGGGEGACTSHQSLEAKFGARSGQVH